MYDRSLRIEDTCLHTYYSHILSYLVKLIFLKRHFVRYRIYPDEILFCSTRKKVYFYKPIVYITEIWLTFSVRFALKTKHKICVLRKNRTRRFDRKPGCNRKSYVSRFRAQNEFNTNKT